MTDKYFSRKTFTFLTQLDENNNRDWFNENKQKYEDEVREPALNFIADISGDLARISPHFNAIPKKIGGSLMRVYRDARFVKDKRPYKTNIGIQFRHEIGKDVHAPGFYVHISPEECFIGVGIWRPDGPALRKIRDRISENSKKWLTITQQKKFKHQFELAGESLVNAPRGYAKDHPMLEDLRRKDHIAITPLKKNVVTGDQFKKEVLKSFREANDYMEFLCKSLNLNY